MGTPTRHANEQQHRSHDEGAVWGAQPAMRPRQWFGRRLGLCQVILAQTGSVLTSAPRAYGRCMYCMHCMHGLSCPILRICMPQHNNVCASPQQSRATRPTRSNTTDCVPMIRCILLQSRKPSNQFGIPDAVYAPYLIGQGWTFHSLPKGAQFNAAYVPLEGCSIVPTRGHICALKHGVIRDTYDCSYGGTVWIKGFYRRT